MIIILIILIIVGYEVLELLFRNSSRYKASLGGAERFRKVPRNIEICNIGSGPGLYAISYEGYKGRGFNFSTAPQNYKYGFRLLKHFRDKIKENAIIVIIIMCPLSFGNNSDYKRKDYSDKFYGVLPKEDIDGYSINRWWIVKHPLFVKCFSKAKNYIKKRKQVEVDNSEPQVVKTWKREFDLLDLFDATQADAHREAFEEKINIIESGIQFCKSNGWHPIFVLPPVPQYTRAFIGTKFIDEFVYKNLAILQNEFSDIKTLDYFADERFGDDCFMNDIFVNEKGQKLFSKILLEDIDNKVKVNLNVF